MCGIYITNIPYSQETVEAKLNQIKFRGPDNTGYSKKDTVSLGHVRLSIQDLDKRSNQPFEYKNYSITYNGEIYNFKDIRLDLENIGYTFETTSDTEVILKGYIEWNEKILDKINGMFSFAIYDSSSQEVFCARDRLGVKPFFYYWKDGKFEMCSQLAPLINESSEMSKQALSIYLDCGYVPSPLSILNDVYKLSPGNFMTINLQKKKLEIKEYWNLPKVKYKDISYQNAKEELHALIKDAVIIRLQSDVPVGSFLSGGIDSALVSAIIAKNSKEKLNTFTIGFEDPEFDESKVAKEFSEIIGSKHIETLCGPKDALAMLPMLIEVYDEPFADSSALPSLLLNSITKPYVTVALTGDGGDESFFGAKHFDTIEKFNKVNRIPFFFRKTVAFFIPKRFKIKEILNLKDENEFVKRIFLGSDSLNLKQDTSWVDQYYGNFKYLSEDPLQKAADLNIKLWLENDSNVKVDRASMAFSVESRSPFLDYRIMEYSRTLPVKYRYTKGKKKVILKDILSEYIPSEVFEQPKKGFSIPLGKWIREDLKEEIELALSDKFLKSVPNLDVEKFKAQKKAHMNNSSDYAFNIWKLYLLSKWMQKYGFSEKDFKK